MCIKPLEAGRSSWGAFWGQVDAEPISGDGSAYVLVSDSASRARARKSGQPHGKGKRVHPNGAVYEGSFEHGCFSGQGEMVYKDGSFYDGRWKDGKEDGWSHYRWKNGDKYYGEWMHGTRHGRWRHMYANGMVYEGDWKKGKPNGARLPG
jgi:hypothetical protein